MGEENATRAKPFPSWIWNDTLNYWIAQIALVKDDENQAYEWDEENQNWYKYPITGSI